MSKKNLKSSSVPIINYACKDIIRGIKIQTKSGKKSCEGSYIQTSIVISAKDLKLLGGVFHKIYFCKDIIRVI